MRSAATSVLTTAIDFAVLIALVELAAAPYAVATFAGSLVGATSNFLINRAWSFSSASGSLRRQALRYALVQVGAALLLAKGVWVLTALGGMRYLVAKTIVSVWAYVVWNYPLYRYFVFA